MLANCDPIPNAGNRKDVGVLAGHASKAGIIFQRRWQEGIFADVPQEEHVERQDADVEAIERLISYFGCTAIVRD